PAATSHATGRRKNPARRWRSTAARRSQASQAQARGRPRVTRGEIPRRPAPRDDAFVSDRCDASRLALGQMRHLGALNTSFSHRERRYSRPSFEPYLSRSSLISFTSEAFGAIGWVCAFLFEGIWNLFTVIATFCPAGDSTKSIHLRAPSGLGAPLMIAEEMISYAVFCLKKKILIG